MAGHVRRFNPSHQWIHTRPRNGELKPRQLDVRAYFFRPSNLNAPGLPRTWTGHLPWHHACHQVDLFQHQAGETVCQCFGLQGNTHKDLGIAMDMSIGLKMSSGAPCMLSLSFNNKGRFGTVFRYICDNATYIARYDDLFDGDDRRIDLSGVAMSGNGIELIDREFFSAIAKRREPNSSVGQCLSSMWVLDRIERSFV